jgi:hypothetical protein
MKYKVTIEHSGGVLFTHADAANELVAHLRAVNGFEAAYPEAIIRAIRIERSRWNRRTGHQSYCSATRRSGAACDCDGHGEFIALPKVRR